MYRNGWEISRASVIANICVAMILLIIGLTVFKELNVMMIGKVFAFKVS